MKGKLTPDDPRHGRYVTYIRFRCKCEPCRAAMRLYEADYRKRKGLTGGSRKWRCVCDDCGAHFELATDLHHHTVTRHRRRPTDAERTPRELVA